MDFKSFKAVGLYKSLFGLVFFLSACASYQKEMQGVRSSLAEGRASKAVSELAPKAGEEGRDQILYMLEYALALHQQGDLKKSNDVLIAVDRLADVKDYVSLSREAGSLLFNEGVLTYKSERFENLLINAYLALNFTLLGDFESALVECRRMDEKIYRMKLEDEDPKKSFYARYLSAMIWEVQGNWDSAYIDYYNAYKIRPHPDLKKDLIRSAWFSQRQGEFKKWRGKSSGADLSKMKNQTVHWGELVFIYQQGWIPRKRPRRENRRFPELVSVPARFKKAFLVIDGERQKPSQMFYQIGQEAKRTLDNEFNYLVAKKILGIVAKQVVAHQVSQKNELLGAATLIAMHLADTADLRQWSTLPDSIQVSRLYLKPGQHHVEIWASGPYGTQKIKTLQVKILPGQKTFITQRTF